MTTSDFTTVLNQYRQRYKLKFADALNEVLQSNSYKLLSNHLKLYQNYKIIIFNEKYKQNLLDSMTYSFSSNTPSATLFGLTKKDRYYELKSQIEHCCETGTYVILINMQNNFIISGAGIMDLCEIYDKSKYSWYYSSRLKDKKIWKTNNYKIL